MKEVFYPELAERVFWDTLPNGLTLAVVPREGFQKKLAYFVTDYGSIHTHFMQDGKDCEAPAGVAHYLEHKLFDMPRGEVSAEFAALGANPNAFTSYDMTAYYFSGTENFEKCLELLLEFVSTPYFTEQSVAKEQGIIAQEIDMTADNAETRVFENLMQAMYPEHPIRVPILGTRETIAEITPQVLEECHRAFYTPDNMILCVVGDVDAQAVRQIACRILPEKAAPKAQKQRQWQQIMTCQQQAVRDRMEIAMPMFQLGFKCEPLEKGETSIRREIIGDLAAEALFGESSQLYLRLYEQGLIDASFGGGFETADGMAMLTAFGDSDDPQAVKEAILDQAWQLVDQGIPEEDFLRMKRSSLGRRIRDLDSFDSVCFRLCAYHFSGFDYFNFPAVYRSVQARDIQDFIQQVVTKERCCLSVITPAHEEVSEHEPK
ncbi:MAG: insulinase family protein [Oscillospiraceae bacterium]|nr:insulinase family protein [Oscillospiraceae bacterium]